uniref:Uncharacterized protein n=1 Tax=Tetraselmis sp. GSL018 TaxID=582737 RepID=A0A061QVM5_9CHLO|mmetsp:Transcript_36397/g.86432  ORF Transcript_36397/g.86432 Transcript_36397/m.86432 type:complete len:83 (+) Transcript_36397:1577-1825(+)
METCQALSTVRALQMTSLLRIRLSSFLAGAALTGGLALYQLRQDVLASHELLVAQTRESNAAVEARVQALEERLATLEKREP